MTVVPRYCPLAQKTIRYHVNKDSQIESIIKRFIEVKSLDYTTAYGEKDASFSSKGLFNTILPGIRHARLKKDLNIFYKIHGKDPRYLDIYAVMTHDESGTGQPANHNKQRTTATRMSNQTF